MNRDSCLIHNRLGNTAQTTASEKGQNFTENGAPNYIPVFHCGGMECNAFAKYAGIANILNLDKNYGRIELWIKMGYAVTLGAPKGIAQVGTSVGGAIRFDMAYNAANYLTFQIYAGGGWKTRVRSTHAWAINEIAHIAYVWDKDNGLGGKRAAIYWNGVDVSITLAGANLDWTASAWPAVNAFYLGIAPDYGAVNGAGLHSQDNCKIFHGTTTKLTSFADRYIEGFGGSGIRTYEEIEEAPPPPPVQVIEPIVCARTYPQVIVAGKDLYALDYVEKIINIDEYKTFQQSKLIQNSYDLTLKNYDDAFSVDNPVSMFSGINWRYSPIQILDKDSEEIWNGVIEDIQRNHVTKLATMVTRNSLVKVMNTKINYVSADWETPADAARNILDQEAFTDYNIASFLKSAATLTANNCYVKCYFNFEDDITLQQCLEKLAEFGAAYCYSHAGNIYYKHWQPFTGGVKVNLTMADPENAPIVSSAINVLVNDYSIGHDEDGGIPATDSDNGNIGNVSRSKFGVHSVPEMGGSSDTQIVFKDSVSAVFIGETLIRRVHQDLDKSYVEPLTIMDFSLPLKHQEWIDLETYFRMTFSEEGWTNKLFEVFRFQRNFDSDRIGMTAYGVQE